MHDYLSLNTKDTETSVRVLTKLLADTYFVYLKTQNCHWNITAVNFHDLHVFLEGQYEELAQAADVIAERIRTLGHAAPGSFTEFARSADITEESLPSDAQGMLGRLLQDHGLIIAGLRKHIRDLRDGDDAATVDLLTQRLAAHEKAAWMLASYIPCR